MLEAVGLGCLRLQRYASENWTFHVRRYTELAGTELSPEDPLMRQLLRLADRHSFLSRILERTHVQESMRDSASTAVTDTWLQRLGAVDSKIQNLIGRVHCFQDWLAAEQLSKGPGMPLRLHLQIEYHPESNIFIDIVAAESDNTLFSLANSNYQTVVELLLGLASCTGLSAAELVAFQTEFGGTAFVCPVKGCERSRLGYASAAELRDHKTRRHIQRLQCYQGKCVYNNVGYSNKSSLHQHVQKVHKKETPRIPTALTRKRKIEDLQIASQQGPGPGAPDLLHAGYQDPTDSLDLPWQDVSKMFPSLPPTVKKWGQFKLWLQTSDISEQKKEMLKALQMQQFTQTRANSMGPGRGPGVESQQPGPGAVHLSGVEPEQHMRADTPTSARSVRSRRAATPRWPGDYLLQSPSLLLPSTANSPGGPSRPPPRDPIERLNGGNALKVEPNPFEISFGKYTYKP